MTFTFYLFLALTGAVFLGFATAWFWQKHTLESEEGKIKALEADLKREKTNLERLSAENETQKLSIENMQKLMQNLENQCFTLEQEVKRAEFSSEILKDEKHRLMAELDAQMRESEAEASVMREMPEIDFEIEDREEEEDLDLRNKAKKLVKAFKKGYRQIDSPPPSNQ